MNWIYELLAVARSLLDGGASKAEIWAFLDAKGVERPELIPAIEVVKGLLEPYLDQATIEAARAGEPQESLPRP